MTSVHPSFFGKKRGNILHFIKECIADPADASNQGSDAAMAALLDRFLQTAVIPGPQAAGELTSVLTHVYKEIRCQEGHSVGKCLLDARTDMAVLRQIKERHQRIAKTSRSKAEQYVATAVYFSAIASAWVFHQEKITSYSWVDLRDALTKVLDKPWIDGQIKELLERAAKSIETQINRPRGTSGAG
jgi:hypothetical protein